MTGRKRTGFKCKLDLRMNPWRLSTGSSSPLDRPRDQHWRGHLLTIRLLITGLNDTLLGALIPVRCAGTIGESNSDWSYHRGRPGARRLHRIAQDSQCIAWSSFSQSHSVAIHFIQALTIYQSCDPSEKQGVRHHTIALTNVGILLNNEWYTQEINRIQ